MDINLLMTQKDVIIREETFVNKKKIHNLQNSTVFLPSQHFWAYNVSTPVRLKVQQVPNSIKAVTFELPTSRLYKSQCGPTLRGAKNLTYFQILSFFNPRVKFITFRIFQKAYNLSKATPVVYQQHCENHTDGHASF